MKTTASATPEHFIELLPAYDYDRQAAFYLDGSPSAERFCFVAVQKRPPYNVHPDEMSGWPSTGTAISSKMVARNTAFCCGNGKSGTPLAFLVG